MPTPAADVEHLLNRVGFGALPTERSSLQAFDWPDLVDHVLDLDNAPPANHGVPNLHPDLDWWDRYVAMVHFWLERCRTSPVPIVEKMVLFWHGHLCSSMDKVGNHQMMFDQNQLFRTDGLGDIETLLQKMAVQPAMLDYLDNVENVAGSPNENFARELMELFTLGVGNYTEDDVLASARAWTGHTINWDTGQYVFRPEDHDNGSKTFLGLTGNLNGPDIISRLVDGPSRGTVANFISSKLWAFLAYPGPEPAVLSAISAAFQTRMHIIDLVRAILLRPEFRSAKAKTGLVRSPIEFVVAGMRHSSQSCNDAHPEWSLSEMGQEPFYPPNVSGWRSNQYWISAPGFWAKSQYASRLRWNDYNGLDMLAGSEELPPAGAAMAALQLFGIYTPSAGTLSALTNFVEEARANARWSERPGLFFITPLTPEFQLA